MPTFKLIDVFGIHNHQVKSYTVRDAVDGRFADALKKDHHIVVYGSSKQGKTSLRVRHLRDEDCTIVRCSPKMKLRDLYIAVLRRENVKINISDTTTEQDKTGGKVKLGPVELSDETGTSTQRRSDFLAYNLEEAQSIGEILQNAGFKKFVVIENFHYLHSKVQRDLARDLKTFHEIQIRFIILGIWRESNMLMVYNPDLQYRITEIPVEPWRDHDFDRVISTGCRLLNVTIIGSVLSRFKTESLGNIGLLQEFLLGYCSAHGVVDTQERTLDMVSNAQADTVLRERAEIHRSYLLQHLRQIASMSSAGKGKRDPLLLPYYLVRCLLTLSSSDIENGIPKKILLERIREMHHREDKETIRSGDITHLLTSLRQIQVDLGTPLLYYNENTRRVCLVDAIHLFVLKRVNRRELLEEIPNPAEDLLRRGTPPFDDEDKNESEGDDDERVHDDDWSVPAPAPDEE